MTKQVRIENADTSSHKVETFCEDLVNGEWVRVANTYQRLDYPADICPQTIWSGRRVIVQEVAPPPP